MKHLNQKGFTLTELVVVMGIFAALSSLMFVNFYAPQSKSALNSSLLTLVDDLRDQQMKAMIGDHSDPHGIHFDSDKYILFTGNTFSASDPNNFVVTLEGKTKFSEVKFPSSTLVFNRVSGEVSGFINGQDSLILTDVTGTAIKTIRVNSYGIVDIL